VKIKSSIMKIIAPKLEEYGFRLERFFTGYCEFENKSKDCCQTVLIDRDPFMGKNLRLCFSISKSDFIDNEKYFYYKRFNPPSMQQGLEHCIRYTNQNELEIGLNYFTDVISRYAIPIFNKLSKPLPHLYYEMYKELSENTSQKAVEYAKSNNNLTFEYCDEAMRWAEKRLDILKGNNYDEIFERFYDNRSEIISMAAYLGEIVLSLKCGGKWIWDTEKEKRLNPPDIPSMYFVSFPPKVRTFEFITLEDIRNYWIEYPELTAGSIVSNYKFLTNLLTA